MMILADFGVVAGRPHNKSRVKSRSTLPYSWRLFSSYCELSPKLTHYPSQGVTNFVCLRIRLRGICHGVAIDDHVNGVEQDRGKLDDMKVVSTFMLHATLVEMRTASYPERLDLAKL